jgi:hypothetical protein
METETPIIPDTDAPEDDFPKQEQEVLPEVPFVLLNKEQLNTEMQRTANELRCESFDLKRLARAYARHDNAYRKKKAELYGIAPGATIPERTAYVDLNSEHERLRAHTSEWSYKAQIELVRSLRAILSSYQTQARIEQEEDELERDDPHAV